MSKHKNRNKPCYKHSHYRNDCVRCGTESTNTIYEVRFEPNDYKDVVDDA